MAFTDPVFLGILVAVVLFFFFIFLFLRRIATGFREGLEGGQD